MPLVFFSSQQKKHTLYIHFHGSKYFIKQNRILNTCSSSKLNSLFWFFWSKCLLKILRWKAQMWSILRMKFILCMIMKPQSLFMKREMELINGLLSLKLSNMNLKLIPMCQNWGKFLHFFFLRFHFSFFKKKIGWRNLWFV